MVVQMSGELCVHRAGELHQDLTQQVRAALRERQVLEVDLSAVTELDSAGVQLLLHAKQTLSRQGAKLHLLRHSEAVVQTFDLLGLARHFGDPMVVSRSA